MLTQWLKKFRSIPSYVADDIFSICRGSETTYDTTRLLKYFSEFGVDKVDQLIDENGLSPLMVALESGASSSRRVAEAFVGAGSDVRRRNSIGFSVFLAACKRRDCLDILLMALQAGMDPNEKMGNAEIGYFNNALGLAVAACNEEAVSALINFGASTTNNGGDLLINWVHAKTHLGNVDACASERCSRILTKLKHAGADLNSPTSFTHKRLTPLQYCLSISNSDVAIKLATELCEAGADPNFINVDVERQYLARSKGVTTLECCRDFRSIAFLRDQGVDIAATIQKHFTPFKLLNLIARCDGPYNGELDCVQNLRFPENRFTKIKLDQKGKILSSNFVEILHIDDVEKVETRIEFIIKHRKNADVSGLFDLVSVVVQLEK